MECELCKAAVFEGVVMVLAITSTLLHSACAVDSQACIHLTKVRAHHIFHTFAELLAFNYFKLHAAAPDVPPGTFTNPFRFGPG